MGTRAYLMVSVIDNVNPEKFVQLLREVEDMAEVDFVDPVEGSCDMVLMIEAPVSVSATAQKIAKLPWVKKLETLTIVSLFERHQASKKMLLESNKQ